MSGCHDPINWNVSFLTIYISHFMEDIPKLTTGCSVAQSSKASTASSGSTECMVPQTVKAPTEILQDTSCSVSWLYF